MLEMTGVAVVNGVRHEARMRRVGMSAGRLVLTLLVMFLAMCAAGEIRQRRLVRRAESLLSDIHSLRLHQSTWSDAQRFMTRWGRWGHYEGVCTRKDCMYVVSLSDLTITRGHNVAEWPSRIVNVASAFRLLPRQWGGGLRLMQAMFLVQNGLVVRSGISVDMTQSPFAKGAQPACCGAELIMSVRSQASLGLPESWDEEQRSRHPDYTTWRPGGCTFCLMGRVIYADGMPAEEAARLSAFQLSCATRWSSCLTLEELNPAAHEWHLYTSPWGDPPEQNASKRMPTGCTLPLYALARDARRIVLVEALGDGTALGEDCDGVGHERARVRLIASLKGASPWAPGSMLRLDSLGSPFDGNVRTPTHLVKRQRYFLMFGKKDDPVDGDRISLENCGIVVENQAGDEEARRGVFLDDQLNGFEPTVSLEGFARHTEQPWDR